MQQMIFFAIGLCVIVLTLASVFKAYARPILWLSAITLFAGTLLLIGIGVINPVNVLNGDSKPFWGTVSMLILSAALVFCAEIQKKKDEEKTNNRKISNTNEIPVSNEQLASNNELIVLPDVLNTKLAREVFAKALQADYMEQEGSHYKWKKSKVLLSYMCGRIYCGDKPQYDGVKDKTMWEHGNAALFPDKDLCSLFQEEDLGQSRTNGKTRAAATPAGSNEIDELIRSSQQAIHSSVDNKRINRKS